MAPSSISTTLFPLHDSTVYARGNEFISAFQQPASSPIGAVLRATKRRCATTAPSLNVGRGSITQTESLHTLSSSCLNTQQRYQHHQQGRHGRHAFDLAFSEFSIDHNFRRSTLLFSQNDHDESNQDATTTNDKKYDVNRNKKPRRQGRNNKESDIYTNSNENNINIVAQLLESSIRFLFQPIYFPFSFIKRRNEKANNVPLVYPLTILVASTIIPFVTWGIFVVFFTLYLAIGMMFMDEYDDLGSTKSVGNDNQYGMGFSDEDDEDESERVVPLAALTGALASAALLSPQGLVSSGSSFSLTSPAAIISLGLGIVALFRGIWGIDDVEKHRREQVGRDERRRMEQWDEKLDDK